MQTPGEKQLINTISSFLARQKNSKPLIINVGAGGSQVIEKSLLDKGNLFMSDRLDVEDKPVKSSYIRNFYHCSAEDMQGIDDNQYDLAFSNYVLEHIVKIPEASKEIERILKPGSIYVASIPNPSAPQFIIAKYTPLWFHKWVRGTNAWKTFYSYKNIVMLKKLFKESGMETIDVKYYSFTEDQLSRFFLLKPLGRLYDKILNYLEVKSIMGDVCIVFQKPFADMDVSD
ncbi:hypothetical protein LCGC14_1000770 [marine sediment metagenome]|uniref:Methyltransferase type 11 domain-containing protein n=1 Tax=marine sediment metagenome TaxID=412755 RepID=A0A0F9QLH3_9ZZZZ|nr:methyltransferase domain-containing protein [Actinomycetota bacterium]